MKNKLFYILVNTFSLAFFAVLVAFNGISVSAQTPFPVFQDFGQSGITNQTQQLQTVQQEIREIEQQKAELNIKISELEKDILQTEVEETEIRAKNSLLQENLVKTNKQIEVNNQKLQEVKSSASSSSNNSFQNQQIELGAVIINLEETTKDITTELTDLNQKLTLSQAEIVLKKSQLEGLKVEIKNLETRIGEKRSQVNSQVGSLQTSLISEFRYWLFYILILILYWGAFRLVMFILKKSLKKSNIFRFGQVLSSIIWILASFITVIIALVQRIEILQQAWAIFALISWAVAWALKDFFASFFSFILILSTREFILGDVVNIGNILGKVTKIGVFNTTLKEIMESKDLKESYSGQIVTVPNNKIMSDPVINYSKQHKIIWRSFRLVFSNDSNLETTKKKLSQIVNDLFNWSVDHKDDMLDNVFNLKSVYEPRMNLVPGKEGPTFLIQFPIRFGAYGKVVDRLTNELYSSFRKKNIELLSIEAIS
jgi:small-conductance mechanosensitive channel